MEVVDGQQRLRTLISYLDSSALDDYDEARDGVVVRKTHNAELAGKPFEKLSSDDKQCILDYEFSTHVLPASAGDELVFRIFARLNSTGLSLNKQEIRNSEFHGAFASLSYELAFQYLDQWRGWQVFTNDSISRMDEVEATSEFLIAMIEGLKGKTQSKITQYYKTYDDELRSERILEDRFTKVMGAIEASICPLLPTSAFKRPAASFSLWVTSYDHMYGLQSALKKRPAQALPSGLADKLRKQAQTLPGRTLLRRFRMQWRTATSDPAVTEPGTTTC